MNRKPAIGIGIAVAIAALGIAALASDSARTEKPAAVDAQEYADFMVNEAFDIQDLAEGAEIQRRMFNRMTPPGFSWIQPMFPAMVPFDAANFDEKFLNELLGADKNSVAIYPLSLMLDTKTRETLVYNADGKLIASIPDDKNFHSWPEDADPTRVTLQLDLLPAEDVEPYLYVESLLAEYSVPSSKSRSAKIGGPARRSMGGDTNAFGICNFQRLTNGNMRLTLTNWTGSAEIYGYTVWHTSSVVVATWTNEESNVVTDTNTVWTPVSPPFNGIESEWECLARNQAFSGGSAVWEDANITSNARIRFYATAKQVDSDGDDLTDGAEIFVHRTDPENDDTDGDGMPDGWELQNTFDPLDDGSVEVRNGADGDPDGDDLRNLDEYLRGLDPLVADWPVVLHVNGTTGNDQTGDGSTNAPYQTIGKATQVGAPYLGCIVWVAGGTYVEDLNLCSGLQLYAVTGQTVEVQGTLSGSMATNMQMQRLTVGTVSLVSCSLEASHVQGGNFVVQDSRLKLSDSQFSGGWRGLECNGTSTAEVVNCFFTGYDTACHMATNASLKLLNTVLVRNYTRAIYGDGAGTLDMNHCVVAYNHWQGIAGGFAGGGISNSVIWKNNLDAEVGGDIQVRYCAFPWPQEANTNGNIQVADPGWINTALDNYRLRSDSPLINQGGTDTTSDLDGEARPYGGASDIGVDEMRDADSDGLADVWEQANNATSPTQYLDGDSMNNLEEYRRGFNPRVTDGPVSVYVSPSGNDETGTGSSGNPFLTVQKGMDWAAQHGGGTVNLTAGDWWSMPFEMRDEVILKGAGQTQTRFHPWEYMVQGNRNVGIEDMAIQDFALRTWRADNVGIKRVRVENQLLLWSINKGTLEDVEVTRSPNTGLEIWSTMGLNLNRCHIHDNDGSGIRVYPLLTDAVVSNTVLAHNEGDGIRIEPSDPPYDAEMAVRHSVVAFNREKGINWDNNPSNASVRNSIFWHNGQDLYNLTSTHVQYSDISDQNLGGTGNLFGVWPRWENSDAGNFHLLTNSPMRNKGVNLAGRDFDNEARLASGATDIGVDQAYYPAGSWFSSNWIAQYGNLSPLADADGDGLTNYEECRNNTNPNSSDTDGDGVSDYQEVWQAGNPTDKSDGGQPPPADEVAWLNLKIGDTSGSLSERYMLQVGSACLTMASYGGSTNRAVPFRIGREYDVRIVHLGSTTNPPDLDYVIDVGPVASSNGAGAGVLKKDPAGLLMDHTNLPASFFTNDAAIVVLKVDLEELYESANPMNRMPNDYAFPEPLPVQNEDADLALPKRPGEPSWDEVQIDRSHLILIASESSANPNPTIDAKWDVQPSSAATALKANATYSIFSEVGQIALSAAGEADFQLPVNNASYYKAWNVFIDDPHILEPDAIGKIILVSQQQWNDAKSLLNVIAAGGGMWPFSYNTARTMLECFVGDEDDAPYAPTDDGTINVVQGDVWYQWLTHKVGLNWSGNTATIPVRKWGTASQFSENVLTSPEFLAQISEALGADFTTLKGLSPGGEHVITFSNREIEYVRESDGGSSDDLFYGIARARLSGTLVVTVGTTHPDPSKVNIESLAVNLQLNDLIDFNYFNTPGNLGALLQAGWKKFDNTSGGAGNVYFTRVLISETMEPFVYEN